MLVYTRLSFVDHERDESHHVKLCINCEAVNDPASFFGTNGPMGPRHNWSLLGLNMCERTNIYIYINRP